MMRNMVQVVSVDQFYVSYSGVDLHPFFGYRIINYLPKKLINRWCNLIMIHDDVWHPRIKRTCSALHNVPLLVLL
jgi:hypothetical protein